MSAIEFYPCGLKKRSQLLNFVKSGWKRQADYIKKEEERLQPIEAHQQAGKQWQETWSYVLKYCNSCASLNIQPSRNIRPCNHGRS